MGSGRSPGGRHGNPLQYSCLENPMDRGACQATVHGVTKSWTWLEQLNTHTLLTRESPLKDQVGDVGVSCCLRSSMLSPTHWSNHKKWWLPSSCSPSASGGTQRGAPCYGVQERTCKHLLPWSYTPSHKEWCELLMPFSSFSCVLNTGFYWLLENGILSPGPAHGRYVTGWCWWLDSWARGRHHFALSSFWWGNQGPKTSGNLPRIAWLVNSHHLTPEPKHESWFISFAQGSLDGWRNWVCQNLLKEHFPFPDFSSISLLL